MLLTFVSIAVVLLMLTVIYRLIPFRELDNEKPGFVFMPKYHAEVELPDNLRERSRVQEFLARHGFQQVKAEGDHEDYTRGHVLGDISIKIVKINLRVTYLNPGRVDLALKAGWIVAFDTGDFWQFLTELTQKLKEVGT